MQTYKLRLPGKETFTVELFNCLTVQEVKATLKWEFPHLDIERTALIHRAKSLLYDLQTKMVEVIVVNPHCLTQSPGPLP
jgi:hypothetical protein